MCNSAAIRLLENSREINQMLAIYRVEKNIGMGNLLFSWKDSIVLVLTITVSDVILLGVRLAVGEWLSLKTGFYRTSLR